MPDMKQIVRMLEEQRRLLLDQLDAVDKAIAALEPVVPDSVQNSVPDSAPSPTDLPETGPQAVIPTHVKARRVLTDAHKEALTAGRRKARQTREVGAGLAREMPGESFVPAIGTRPDPQAPRLIKRPTRK